MKNSTQTSQRNSLFIEGKAKDVAEKLAGLYTGPSTRGTGQTKLLDFSKISNKNSESLKNLGLIIENIDEAYSVNALHEDRMTSEFVMGFLGPLESCQAVVISYKTKPNVSEVFPTYLENSLIEPKRISGLGLKILDI